MEHLSEVDFLPEATNPQQTSPHPDCSHVTASRLARGLASSPPLHDFRPREPPDPSSLSGISRWTPPLSFDSRHVTPSLLLPQFCRLGEQGRLTDPHMSRASAIPFFLGHRLAFTILVSGNH